MSPRPPYIDILDWDPVRFSVQIADVTDEGLKAYFDEVEARLRLDHAEGRRFALVFDPRHGRPPTLEQRLIQARFIERTAPLVAEVNLGTALCTPSAVLRGMMAALFWVARSPSPQISLPSMRAALDWAIEKVVAAGLEVPKPLRSNPDAVLAEVHARGVAARF
jgi:hypothetical protein